MYLLMQHTVRDYDDWKPVFDGGEQVRTRHGCTGHEIYRGDDDANDVTVMLDFPSREAGEAFLADPELHQRMDEAGVTVRATDHVGDADAVCQLPRAQGRLRAERALRKRAWGEAVSGALPCFPDLL